MGTGRVVELLATADIGSNLLFLKLHAVIRGFDRWCFSAFPLPQQELGENAPGQSELRQSFVGNTLDGTAVRIS